MDTRVNHLYEAAHAGDVYSLNTLLEEDNLLLDRVVTTTAVSDNPLHIAALLGHAAFAREILHRKPKLAREFNGQGMSPLHLATAQGHFKVVEELLQVDADLCYLQENIDGYLPVHIAVIKGRHDLFTLLTEQCEGSLNELTYSSETLLHLAIKANCLKTIELVMALGVTQLTLNAKDSNGNTSLHLAFAARQQQVIKHLLSQKDIDVNPINSAGLTPLDILLVTNQKMGDLYLGEMIRAAGGITAKELETSEINPSDSTSVGAPNTSQARFLSIPTNRGPRTPTLTKVKESNGNIVDNLIVVATLVATVTFAAALNPPGGFIQLDFNDKDPDWFRKWKHMKSLYPAGSPVYLWKLRNFYKYDYFALFTSITVIILCLLGGPTRSITMMKALRLGVWFSILFMAFAFNSALSILLYYHKNYQKFQWFTITYALWILGFALTAQRLVNDFVTSLMMKLYSMAKLQAPNWVSKTARFIRWEKVKQSIRWEKTKPILSGIFRFSIAFLVGYWVGETISKTAARSIS